MLAHYDCWLLTLLVTSCTSLHSVLPSIAKHIINHRSNVLWLVARRGHCRLDKSPIERGTLCAKGLWTKYSHLWDWDQWGSWPALSQPQVQLIKMWRLAGKKPVTKCNYLNLKWIFSLKDKTAVWFCLFTHHESWNVLLQLWHFINDKTIELAKNRVQNRL